jgi:hypothetical protein
LLLRGDYAAKTSVGYIKVIASDARGLLVYCMNAVVVVEVSIIVIEDYRGCGNASKRMGKVAQRLLNPKIPLGASGAGCPQTVVQIYLTG